MFSSSIHLLTCLAMLAHSVLGCCWHHAHADSCHAEHFVMDEATPAHHHGQPREHHACDHAHADRANEHRHPHAAHGDAMLLPCCGDHEQQRPCECCVEAECTYLPTASPVLTGPVDMPACVSANVVLALSAAASLPCCRGVREGCPSTTTAEHCALVQVWRL